jgi:hypothetical protein
MTRSGVAFLAVQDFRSEIYWIVSKACSTSSRAMLWRAM